jgi:hypothetical protein
MLKTNKTLIDSLYNLNFKMNSALVDNVFLDYFPNSKFLFWKGHYLIGSQPPKLIRLFVSKKKKATLGVKFPSANFQMKFLHYARMVFFQNETEESCVSCHCVIIYLIWRKIYFQSVRSTYKQFGLDEL